MPWLHRLWCVTSVAAGITLSAASTTASATTDLPDPLVEEVHQAIDEWARFATTGELAELSSSFFPGGPQWRQFEAEVASPGAAPGVEPLRLEVRQIRLRSLDSTTATLWAEVAASRAGFISEIFGWDFDLIYGEGLWRVWTVVAATEPTVSVHTPPTVIETTTTAVPASVVDSEARTFDGGTAAAKAESPKGTRLPALSAWIVVITVVGVAVAGYMAPRIDRKGEG